MPVKLPKTRNMLRREAARWLARLRSGGGPEIEQKFRRWYEGDPAHAAAFERIRRSYEQAGLLRQSALVDRPFPAVREHRPRQQRHALAVAASLVLVVSGVVALSSATRLFGSTDVLMLATRVGEIREIRLSDGSKVTLDTATTVEVEIGHSRRRARLSHGRARFSIAKANAPFVIEAGSTSVTTAEGLVDIERMGDRGHVAMLAGHANVRAAGERKTLALAPGEGLSMESGRPERKEPAAAGADWTSGMLEFDSTPLAEAVALANRYSANRLVLDPRVDRLRVTGAFHAGDTAGLARALAAAFRLHLVETPEGDLLLSPRESLAPRK